MRDSIDKILSQRELKILELVAKGLTSEKIGSILSIATSTVQTHRRNMLRKTGKNNTQQLISVAYQEGILI